jgi:hypothetical protein
MAKVRFALGYLAVVIIAGLGGFLGSFVMIVLIGGIRDPSVWDMLTIYQIGGLSAAAASFHAAMVYIMQRRPPGLLEIALFLFAQFSIGPFARFVVASELTGDQGQTIVVAVLIFSGALIAWFTPPGISRSMLSL